MEKNKKEIKKAPAAHAADTDGTVKHAKPEKAPKIKKEKAPKAEKAPKEKKSTNKKAMKKLRNALIITAGSAAVLVGAAAFAGYKITESPANLPNVYADGVFVGNMTEAETLEKLKSSDWEKLSGGKLSVSLPADTGFEVELIPAGAKLTEEQAVQAAQAYGHTGGWFENLGCYIRGFFGAEDVCADTEYDSEYIYKQIDRGIKSFGDAIGKDGYTVDEEKAELVLIKGAGQLSLDRDDIYAKVVSALDADESSLKIALPETDIKMPDFAKIHKELEVEPQDAYFDAEKREVAPSVEGFRFDVKEAEKLWSAAAVGARVAVPVEIIEPELTTEKYNELLFRDCLGSQITYFSSSTANRKNNIDLAAQKLNEFIICPGEIFSYNGTVGERTASAGFKEAGAYASGKVVQEIGGGICQVSSTLYVATLLANMEIVDRTNHMFAVGYLPLGLDATVSWPEPDFKFRNNREFPVKIVAYTDFDDDSLHIEIWGTDVDGSYVEIIHGAGIRYDTTTYPGYSVEIGKSAYVKRNIYSKDGVLIDVIEDGYSGYDLHAEDIKWPEIPADPGTGGEGGEGGESGGDTGGGDSGGGAEWSEGGGGSGGDSGGGESGGDTGAAE